MDIRKYYLYKNNIDNEKLRGFRVFHIGFTIEREKNI